MITRVGYDVGETDVPPPVTSSAIRFDADMSDSESSSVCQHNSSNKRLGTLPALFLASSLASFTLTAPKIVPTDIYGIDESRLASADRLAYTLSHQVGRRITLREAKQIALRGHELVEQHLREDRAQEARLSGIDTEDDTSSV